MRVSTQGEGAVTPQMMEPDLPASVGGSAAEAGGGCGSPGGQGHWQLKIWKVLLGMSPPESTFSPTKQQVWQAPVLRHLRPNNQQGGNAAPPNSKQGS